MREGRIKLTNSLNSSAGDMVGDKDSRIWHIGLDHGIDQLLRNLLDHGILGIRPDAMPEGGIVICLQDHIVLHRDSVRHRRAQIAQRLEFFLAGHRITVVHDLHRDQANTVRRRHYRRADVQFVG